MNGKAGDSPITDIMIHGLNVYSAKADLLIREIVQLGGRDQIEPMLLSDYSPYLNPDVRKLEEALRRMAEALLPDESPEDYEADMRVLGTMLIGFGAVIGARFATRE